MSTKPTSLTLPALGAYWPGQGGFYIGQQAATPDAPARYLIAAATKNGQKLLQKKMTWGPSGQLVDGAGSISNGQKNTAVLLAHGAEFPAAKWASEVTGDGHSDFYLPSQLELMTAHANASALFEDGVFWSSTQLSRSYAFVQAFAYGNSYWGLKGSEYRVAAFRAIQLHHFDASTLDAIPREAGPSQNAPASIV